MATKIKTKVDESIVQAVKEIFIQNEDKIGADDIIFECVVKSIEQALEEYAKLSQEDDDCGVIGYNRIAGFINNLNNIELFIKE